MSIETRNNQLPKIRPPEDFFIPAGYAQQEIAHSHDKELTNKTYWTDERLRNSSVYQFHVYRWAAQLISDRNLTSTLDVGCGTGIKLRDHIKPVCSDIEGFDQPAGIKAAQRFGSPGTYTSVDLENPHIKPHRTFDLIICADVVEHLLDPDPMLKMIKKFCHPQTLMLFSTPDRARLHGRTCMASTKPEHVREWTGPEFHAFLTSRGFHVTDHQFLPADNAPISSGAKQESLFAQGLAPTSPHRCQAVLCNLNTP